MSEVIVIASQKGGVGKTTTAVNLGTSLAILGQRVLLIDLDPQGSIAANFHLEDINVEYGLYDVIVKQIPLALAICDIGLDYLEIVPANIKDEEEEIEFFTHALQDRLLKGILSTIRNEYDYIILDCPPSLGSVTMNALAAADSLIIPVQAEYFSLRALGKFLRSIRNVGKKHNPHLKLKGILITMYDKRLARSKKIVRELQYGFKNIVFKTIIPRNSRLAEAPALGKPVALLDMSSPGAIAYFKLAEEIINSKNRRKKTIMKGISGGQNL